MDYKLALKLKEAGFPPISHIEDMDTGSFCTKCEWDKYSKPQKGIEDFCYPDLSELIEACLDFYFPCSFEMGGMNTWWAVMRDEKNIKALVPVQTGSTPEEAVANLLLHLLSDKSVK